MPCGGSAPRSKSATDRFASAQARRSRQPRERGERWQQVDVLHGILHPASSRLRARQAHDPGHADDLVVEKQSVLFFDVIAEALAVIREHGDRRGVIPAARLQTREERADDLVGERHFTVVGGEVGESFGRPIRFVRLVKMQEEKEAIRGQRAEPRFCGGKRLRSGTLDLRNRAIRGHHRKRGVVDVESLRDAGLRPQDVRRHEAPGLVSRRAKHLGQSRRARFQREPEVVANLVFERQPAGEHRHVRRECLRCVSVGAIEHDRFTRERRERRRSSRLVTVDRQSIRAKGVDDDEDDRPGPAKGLP